MNVGVIIPAAGVGRRMGGTRKALMTVAGKPMLQYSVEAFLAHQAIDSIVVALAYEDLDDPPDWLRRQRILLVHGGAKRADSVRSGLLALPDVVDAVIVHDAARPLVNATLIDRVLNEVRKDRSVTVAIPVTDTLHEVDAHGVVQGTPNRERFWRAQTPQAFPRDILQLAFANVPTASHSTDEAGLVSAGGWPVCVVPGESWNIKITTPDDLALVESALRARGA